MLSNSTSPSRATTTQRPSTPTPSTSAAAETHTIKVGPKEDPHAYVPRTLTANVGDLVIFEFYPRNHSVVQADWRAPCVPADGDYFFSGIKNDFEEVNGQVVGRLPTWNLTVESEEPMFFYCTGTVSCIGNGMVGVINPNSTMTWESQYSAAREAPYMLLPGQSMPAEGETDSPGTGTTPHTTASPTSNPSPGTLPHSSSSSSLGAGAIAGIAVGAVSFVVILCVLLFILGRNHVYRKWVSSSENGGNGSVNALRTARWALSTSADGGTGSGGGKSEGEGGFGGSPGGELGLTSAPGPGPVFTSSGSATGTGAGTGFGSMDYPPSLSRSAMLSAQDSGYGQGFGTGHPSSVLTSQVLGQSPGLMQGMHQAGQQGQQQPYWIWDQSIQPHPYMPKKDAPSELDGEPSR
ncbi:hypothetical protein BJY01DRAFT_245306 [Aspergillus pseudoustus]|uniref:Extracellular serine-rich protein n=1 Tax=Aspergillus pseudoustus TaxID=1810923 RepID=A0ABR4KG28_9EURO